VQWCDVRSLSRFPGSLSLSLQPALHLANPPSFLCAADGSPTASECFPLLPSRRRQTKPRLEKYKGEKKRVKERERERQAKMLSWATLAAAALLANGVAAQNMLRFACSQLVVDRVDPIVNPGVRYTPHLHQIVGGNSFNLTMDIQSHDLAAQSSCTSCTFAQDLSNYWTAVMFFKAKNGTYKRVPQIGNGGPQGALVNKGGLDVYYIPSGKTTAFKPVCLPFPPLNPSQKEKKF
jgi:hypothetical protein